MVKIILVTGGARSGKSAVAEETARSVPGRRWYLATCPVLDDETRERIRRHREKRAADHWTTVEEQFDLANAVSKIPNGVILIDCLTLWINNLLFRDPEFNEDRMRSECETLQNAFDRFPGTVVLVINEVGLGIVPESHLSRVFRDCSGVCGAFFAQHAETVFFCVCGLKQKWKG